MIFGKAEWYCGCAAVAVKANIISFERSENIITE